MSDEIKKNEAGEGKPAQSDDKAAKANSPKKDKKPSLFARIGKFFKEIKSEAKKVVWPTWKATLNNSIAVIIAIVIVGLFTGGLDTLFSYLRNLIVGLL